MPRNEAQTRFELIDPTLEDRGWNCRTDIRVEETAKPIDIVNHQARERVAGRTDYVLRRPLTPGAEPVPLAIMEAKHEGLPPEHGLQQGKSYRIGQLHYVPFVFSSNGHLFVEYDEEAGTTSEPRPLTEFPTPEELVQRYLAVRGLNPQTPAFKLLEIPYHQGPDYFRYYQDAGMRATFEQIIRAAQDHKPARALLPIATGGGKTRMAAGLLRRICDAGLMGKALFVCDRTELRDNGLGDFQAAFGNDAAEIDTRNPQKNAKVIIATYQTLDHKARASAFYKVTPEDDTTDPDSPPIDVTFFLKHYPPGYFDVIVIDECHRSAWGKWFVILEQNSQAIQIGLTATPRQLQLPEVTTAEFAKQIEEDRRLLADNLRYFGEPVYEYTYQQGVADGYLAPCEIEQYDIHHDGALTPERIRGVLRADVANKKLTDLHTGHTLTSAAVPLLNEPATLEGKLVMPDRVKAMSAHLFERLLATGDHSPLRKTIVFCASDHHADLITNALNGLYSAWAKANGQKRIQNYAFKCMSSVNGQALIPDFRGRARSHIIATNKDLLTTGVNVPCVRNIVFFRYVQSPLLFHQMVGRGTRIDRESGKLMFRIFDYTGATALFGAEFVTAPPPEPGPPKPPPPPGPPVQKIRVKGVDIEIRDTGRFNLLAKDGRLQRVTPQEYRDELTKQLIAAVPTLADFRVRWLDPVQRDQMLQELRDKNLLPEVVSEGADMEAFDEFDILAALAYGVQPMTRAERAAKFGDTGPDWLVQLPQPTAKVIRAIVRQFERAGTSALEATELWRTPEIQELKGLDALKQGGQPADLLRKTKETLFAA